MKNKFRSIFLALLLSSPRVQAAEEGGDNTTVPSFDPTSDPEWPGVFPPPQSQFEFIINIRFDDYASETGWVLEQFVGTVNDMNDIVNMTVSTSRNAATDWMVIDSYNGTFDEAGAMDSYRQFRSPQSLYHFYITDDFDDGICCGYGEGWVAITTLAGVLWSIPGDEFQDYAEVFFKMELDGSMQVIEREQVDSSPTSISQEMLSTATFLPDFSVQTINTTEESPQEDALLWLLLHPEYPTMPEWRKQQLFGYATFLYSTKRSRVLDTTVSECHWKTSPYDDGSQNRCDDFGHLQLLQVHGSDGTIPAEISMMPTLRSLDMTSNSDLRGTLPTELFALTGLGDVWLLYNRLSGTIPTELGLLTNLHTLVLSSNILSGQVPTEIGLLTFLSYASLSHNDLTGKITTEICDGRLSRFEVDCREVSCPCRECECGFSY